MRFRLGREREENVKENKKMRGKDEGVQYYYRTKLFFHKFR